MDNIIFIFLLNPFIAERGFSSIYTAFKSNYSTLFFYSACHCFMETSPYESDPKFAVKKNPKRNENLMLETGASLLKRFQREKIRYFAIWQNKNTTWADPENSVRVGGLGGGGCWPRETGNIFGGDQHISQRAVRNSNCFPRVVHTRISKETICDFPAAPEHPCPHYIIILKISTHKK